MERLQKPVAEQRKRLRIGSAQFVDLQRKAAGREKHRSQSEYPDAVDLGECYDQEARKQGRPEEPKERHDVAGRDDHV